jgi:HSP20 family molecular chaperone IbpA
MAALTRTSIENRANILQAIGWQVNIHSYSWSPPTDVYETDVSFVVRVEVAGMRESDFSINIDKNFLVISGVRVDVQEWKSASVNSAPAWNCLTA